MDAAAAAFKSAKGRPFPAGKGKPGSWISVGPSRRSTRALLLALAHYIPNGYVAGGRTTSIAISDTARSATAGVRPPAGGGVWRTKNALTGDAELGVSRGPFGIDAVGSVALDPNDSDGNTLYVGTGEANICGSAASPAPGIYRSTDGGTSGRAARRASTFDGRAVGTIAVKPGDPNTIYAGSTTRAARRFVRLLRRRDAAVPGAAQWGLYNSTDGGATWTFIHNGASDDRRLHRRRDRGEQPHALLAARRAARRHRPVRPEIVYAGSYARGVWRSTDGGRDVDADQAVTQRGRHHDASGDRREPLPNGKTRMYIARGRPGQPDGPAVPQRQRARPARRPSPTSPAPTWRIRATVVQPLHGQCWYDSFVYTPEGYPDVVYVGGSYSYGETVANRRGVVLSTDAGVTVHRHDDGRDRPAAPERAAPRPARPRHVNPNNPYQFFEANDGGLMRSSGAFVDVCLVRHRAACPTSSPGASSCCRACRPSSGHQQGADDAPVPEPVGEPVQLEAAPGRHAGQRHLAVEREPRQVAQHHDRRRRPVRVRRGEPEFRFHTFFGASPDVNFSSGDTPTGTGLAIPLGTGGLFYVPIISDPVVSQDDVRRHGERLRTKTGASGTMTLAQSATNATSGRAVHRDVRRLGALARPAHERGVGHPRGRRGRRGRAHDGGHVDRVGGHVDRPRVHLEERRRRARGRRSPGRASTMPTTPNRFVSGISVDPANATAPGCRTAATTPHADHTRPRVRGRLRPGTGTATWMDRSYDLGRHPDHGHRLRRRATATSTRRPTSACFGSRRAPPTGRSRRRACRTSRSPG